MASVVTWERKTAYPALHGAFLQKNFLMYWDLKWVDYGRMQDEESCIRHNVADLTIPVIKLHGQLHLGMS